ncbi:hypothetical protein RHDE110596_16195 [Prescottella defluvii]|nr:hypothetical protein [Prescottella defluvii]
MARLSWQGMGIGELVRAWWDYQRYRMRWGLPILIVGITAAALVLATGR